MKLPTLFKKTSTGAIQTWTISTLGNCIFTNFGQLDGKIQETKDVIKSGKNLDKKNATTPEEQARTEAKAKWEKQLKKGYVQSRRDAEAGKVDAIIEGGIAPMLAHKFSEQAHKILYPAFAQPKFDGHRCIAVITKGKATLWSRTRKPITGLPHIVKALEEFSDLQEVPNITLDGELYNHAYRTRFEELTSFIRTPEAKPGHEVVQYHVYDIAKGSSQATRFNDLAHILKSQHPLIVVETISVADEDELMLAFERFLSEGYEGLMVRNSNGLYVNKRSYDLQKVKEFEDREFEVVDVEEGRGKLTGHAIFVCDAGDGVLFRAKMKGKTEDLKRYFEHPELAIGKQLTVKFQGWTNKSGVPRFPVALRFRTDL